jgi:class 3 adenylate cyclase
MAETVMGTFLFTDLVDSTALSSSLGQAAADELRQSHFSLLRGAVAATGGTEVKNLGDGLMVMFLSPSRAVACSVAMQQAVERHNRRAEQRLGIRVGIAAGEATFEENDYFGEPVVTAARLCGRAEGGQILATAVLRQLVGRNAAAEFQEIGALDLKGLPEPVETAEVVWEPAAEAELDQNGVPLPVRLAKAGGGGLFGFSGRGPELDKLTAALKQATTERRLVTALVSGEPGVGKTALAAQLAREAHAGGATVVFGDCPDGTSAPYMPWLSAFSEWMRSAPSELLSELTPVHAGALGRLLRSEEWRLPPGEPAAADADSERFLLMESVVHLLETMSSESGALVVLDDLHWADSATVDLLRHVIWSSAPLPVLLVLTYRPSDLSRHHPLSALLADLHREPATLRIELSGLSDSEIVDLLQRAAGYELDDAGVALAHALRRETDGNPFFVGELLRHLGETGAIAADATGRYALATKLDQLELPPSVRDVVVRRVVRLGDEQMAVLTAASVIGREFDLDLLADLTGEELDTVLDLVDQAALADVVSESETAGAYRFTHALVQHALYRELSAVRRQRMHLQVAELLEARPATQLDAAGLAMLAYHYKSATRPAELSKAIEYARRAGDAALESLAPSDAVSWYTQALELAEREGSEDARLRGDLLLRLAEAQLPLDHTTSASTLKEAGALAEVLGDQELLTRLALTRIPSWRTIGAPDADLLRLYGEALDRIDPTNLAVRARVRMAIAEEMDPEEWRTRRQLADQALTEARASGDDGALLDVVLSRDFMVPAEEVLSQEHEELTSLALSLAETRGDPVVLSHVLWVNARCELVKGEVARGRALIRRMEELAGAYRLPVIRATAATQGIGLAMLSGDLTDMERKANQLAELGTQGFPAAWASYGGALFELGFVRGRLEEFASLFADTPAAAYPAFRPGLATAYLASGNEEQARLLFERDAADGFASFPHDQVWIGCMVLFTELAVALAEDDAAAALYELLEPHAALHAVAGPIYYGYADRAVGRLAVFLGRVDEGEARLRHSLEVHRALGARYWAACNAVDLAEALFGAGRPAGDAEVISLLQEARTSSESGGYGRELKRLDRLRVG